MPNDRMHAAPRVICLTLVFQLLIWGPSLESMGMPHRWPGAPIEVAALLNILVAFAPLIAALAWYVFAVVLDARADERAEARDA